MQQTFIFSQFWGLEVRKRGAGLDGFCWVLSHWLAVSSPSHCVLTKRFLFVQVCQVSLPEVSLPLLIRTSHLRPLYRLCLPIRSHWGLELWHINLGRWGKGNAIQSIPIRNTDKRNIDLNSCFKYPWLKLESYLLCVCQAAMLSIHNIKTCTDIHRYWFLIIYFKLGYGCNEEKEA